MCIRDREKALPRLEKEARIKKESRPRYEAWLEAQQADVVCVQELKAQITDLSADMLAPDSYRGYFHCAAQRGYSGVGIYCRKQPDNVIEGIGITEIDDEGRFIQADFGNLSIISIYLPSGSSGDIDAYSWSFLSRGVSNRIQSCRACRAPTHGTRTSAR